jgi:metallo-beta-lactamase class B
VNRPSYAGIREDFEKSFARLKSLPCDVFFAPHAHMFALDRKRARMGRTPNPFIDAKGCKDYLNDAERAFKLRLKLL